MTAQILVDALKSRRVAINDFSLLIFDECHHTDKGHPYNDIMLKYLEIKFPSRGCGPAEAVKERLPQIIGLTASLGVGKARNKNEAQEHILQLCANLDCSVIVTVEKYKKDLKGWFLCYMEKNCLSNKFILYLYNSTVWWAEIFLSRIYFW